MANSKIQDLTAATTFQDGNDVFVLVKDPGGTPLDRKMIATNVFANLYKLVSTTLGDIIYGAASGAATRLGGNTSATKKYLSQTGDGANSAAPAWSQPAASELSDYTIFSEASLPAPAVWTGGTVPGLSGNVYERYRYIQVGKLINLTIYLKYSVAGATCTRVRIPFPSGVPLPTDWTNTVDTEVVLSGSGAFSNASTSIASTTGRCFITKDAGSATGYYIYADGNSTSANFAMMNFVYRSP
jgi:hypothetical protein